MSLPWPVRGALGTSSLMSETRLNMWQYVLDHWMDILGWAGLGAGIVAIIWVLSSRGPEGNQHQCAVVGESGFTVCRPGDTPENSVARGCRLSGSNRVFDSYRCME